MVTGISGAIAVVATLMTWTAEASGDPLHPGSNAGWFAFPAGFVALGGLTALLGDVISSSTAGPVGRGAMGPQPVGTRRRRGAVWLALLTYAIVLFLGALGAIAYTIYDRDGIGVGDEIFVFLCAAAFLWGVLRLPRRTTAAVQETRSDEEPAPGAVGGAERLVIRQWGLALTGVGAGITVALYWYIAYVNHFFWSGVLFGPIIFAAFGLTLAICGMVLLIIEPVMRLTGRRH
ncbi:hypothetical protein RF640_18070 [Kocuria sp. CPCC 205231]|uniref:hypothetical protein n=1 Tax=Kocuria sp. CPCC 205231 TaxID=3073551 RepID=UPI0034D4F5C7